LLEFYFLAGSRVVSEKAFLCAMMITECALIGSPAGSVDASVTVLAGFVWSVIYYRYRCCSRSRYACALGTAFYYGIMGQDLAAEWKGLFH